VIKVVPATPIITELQVVEVFNIAYNSQQTRRTNGATTDGSTDALLLSKETIMRKNSKRKNDGSKREVAITGRKSANSNSSDTIKQRRNVTKLTTNKNDSFDNNNSLL
jgi:hypothetical protein